MTKVPQDKEFVHGRQPQARHRPAVCGRLDAWAPSCTQAAAPATPRSSPASTPPYLQTPVAGSGRTHRRAFGLHRRRRPSAARRRAFAVAVTDSVRPPAGADSGQRRRASGLRPTLTKPWSPSTARAGRNQAWPPAGPARPTAHSGPSRSARAPASGDGTPVSAADVLAAWSAAWQRADAATAPWAWLGTQSGSIQAPTAETLTIRLRDPQPGFPLLLAHPAAAVAVRRPGWTWPVGSGPCRLRASTPSPLPDLTCRPNSHHPRRPTWRELTFLVQPGRDARDLVAGEADLLMIGDPAGRGLLRRSARLSHAALALESSLRSGLPAAARPAGRRNLATGGRPTRVAG